MAVEAVEQHQAAAVGEEEEAGAHDAELSDEECGGEADSSGEGSDSGGSEGGLKKKKKKKASRGGLALAEMLVSVFGRPCIWAAGGCAIVARR
jgi:hypothetical protein